MNQTKKTLRLLYVEDDRYVADAFKRCLEDRGCTVTHTVSAAQAVHLLRTSTFDGVLTDWEVLEGDGDYVATEATIRKVPVRIMSGRLFPDERWTSIWIAKGHLAPVYDFLESLR